MGLVYRRRKRLTRNTWVNAGTGGASVSARRGRVTVNTRGRGSIRIMRGLSFRFRLW